MSLNIISTISYNNPGALVRPNSITVYSKSSCLVQKAVFHSCPATILIRLQAYFRSNLVNHLPPLVLSSSALMSGRGYLFGIVRRFRDLSSMQSLRDLSFLHTNRIGAAAVEQEHRTFPVGMFSCKYLHRAWCSSQVVVQMAPVVIFAFGSWRGI